MKQGSDKKCNEIGNKRTDFLSTHSSDALLSVSCERAAHTESRRCR